MFHKTKRLVIAIAAVSALTLGASAISSAASSPSTTTSTSSQPSPRGFDGPAHGTTAHENAEKPVTGSAATKAQAAAVKAVRSGTAGAVTTDYGGRGYEVTVTKSDGTKVAVHLDSAFQVVRGPGGHCGPPPSGA
jgi:hypothetical protein